MSTILESILQEIEYDHYDRMIEEGKDPIELLHYKFQDIPSGVIDKVIEIDPTKKKSYSQWLLSKWDNESDVIIDGLRNGRIKKLFDHYKNHQDIQIKECPSVEEGLDKFVPQEDTVLVKSDEPTTVLMNNGWREEVPSILANDFNVVFNDDDWIIAVPNTYEADCKLGENMYWCTAGGRSSFHEGRSYYDRYLSDYGGKYYVNFDMSRGESRLGKDYPFTRYQFHFESNQFMDKNDEPVELNEIWMPQSAIEFYDDEGYDVSLFENIEERADRYDEERVDVSYEINDELFLCIEYDENYEFVEPNEDTPFYIFSINDYRDPISWIEVPNPYVNNDVVKFANDWLAIVSPKNGEAIVAHRSRYSWDATECARYLLLPNGVGVLCATNDGYYEYAYDGATIHPSEFNNLGFNECNDMFINKECTNAYVGDDKKIFIETIADGYHSLFVADYNGGCKLVVAKDFPKNGKYFTINERSLIEGEFRSYRVYPDDMYDQDDEYIDYDMFMKLPNGDYVVSVHTYEGSEKNMYNVVKNGTMSPLIDMWFDKYIGDSAKLYCFKLDDKVAFFSKEDGRQVGEWYNTLMGVDKANDVVCGVGGRQGNDIIMGDSVIARFSVIINKRFGNNKLLVGDSNDDIRLFDYTTREFFLPELKNYKKIPSDNQWLYECEMGVGDKKALFDMKNLRVLESNLRSIDRVGGYYADYFLIITRESGKVNVFDINKMCELLDSDVDEVTSMNENTKALIYRVGDRYYPYNYLSKKALINPNGVPIYARAFGSRFICFMDNRYRILFVPNDSSNDYKFYAWDELQGSDSGTKIDPMNTPREVIEMYNIIVGGDSNQPSSSQDVVKAQSFSENFKRFMNRLLDADKLRYNDLID